jgi:hypothetical protein
MPPPASEGLYLACFGLIDMRAQADVPGARRTDSPTRLQGLPLAIRRRDRLECRLRPPAAPANRLVKLPRSALLVASAPLAPAAF